MLGLTALGVIHTAVSLIAVASGFWALARTREISARDPLGQTYLIATLLTALTGLGIFQHGGFRAPHEMSLYTLLALALGTVAALTGLFGRWSRYVQAIGYSATMFFHMIAGFTEALTRLPPGQPLLPNMSAPAFGPIYLTLLLLFLVGLVVQLLWLRGQAAKPRGQARE